MPVKIVTDSTCDLPQSVVEALGIEVVPLFINIGQKGYLDGLEITRTEFYRNLPGYPEHPTTATPSIDSFTETYQRLAEAGATEILSLHISSSLSATIDMARQAAARFKGARVVARDSGQLSLGLGFQVEAAAKLAKEGKGLDEIEAALDDLAPRTYVAAHLDTLEFLRRSGRMNGVVTGLGSLLQIKPLLTMEDGQPGSERVRTIAKAQMRLKELLDMRKPIERFALLHSNAVEKAQAFKETITHLIPSGEHYSMDITPVLGVHLGPDAVGYAIVRAKTD